MNQETIAPVANEKNEWLRIDHDPEERRRKARVIAMLDEWIAEAEPGADESEEWQEIERNLTERRLRIDSLPHG